ncbi:hypothetical protein NPJ88_006515 [Halomonas elongata]|uniref:hypothetical protein n=1 Tax=Halomonas elongata TaxID=2746 RepID=UPI00255AF6E3|nr:hypothetical protein [Halomonas elongata]MDL4861979.1 hypothetical protein [Halomonas elongata]
MSTTKQPGRPKGRHNTKPTKQEVAGYFELLRGAADAGDVNAAAKLIELNILERTRHEQ